MLYQARYFMFKKVGLECVRFESQIDSYYINILKKLINARILQLTITFIFMMLTT